MSKSEEKICNVLYKDKVKYVREKTFSDLRYGKLRFDFFLPELGVLVEYDSELHFIRVDKFHKTDAEFHHAQQNDRLKNAYALAHKIPLYRIPYWELNNIHTISDILQSKFLVKSKWHNDQIYRKYKEASLD